jgi:hypothetical protein
MAINSLRMKAASGLKHSYDLNRGFDSQSDELEPLFGQTLFSSIIEAHQRCSGSTFNILHGNISGLDAFAVCVFPERSLILEGELSLEALVLYAVNNYDLLQDPLVSLGTWKSGSKTYLDVASLFYDEHEARHFGVLYEQQCIFHLKRCEYLHISEICKSSHLKCLSECK